MLKDLFSTGGKQEDDSAGMLKSALQFMFSFPTSIPALAGFFGLLGIVLIALFFIMAIIALVGPLFGGGMSIDQKIDVIQNMPTAAYVDTTGYDEVQNNWSFNPILIVALDATINGDMSSEESIRQIVAKTVVTSVEETTETVTASPTPSTSPTSSPAPSPTATPTTTTVTHKKLIVTAISEDSIQATFCLTDMQIQQFEFYKNGALEYMRAKQGGQ